jgi:hypothetical protein
MLLKHLKKFKIQKSHIKIKINKPVKEKFSFELFNYNIIIFNRKQLIKSKMFTSYYQFNDLKFNLSKFILIVKATKKNIKKTRLKIKNEIKKILNTPYNLLYIIFKKINNILFK